MTSANENILVIDKVSGHHFHDYFLSIYNALLDKEIQFSVVAPKSIEEILLKSLDRDRLIIVTHPEIKIMKELIIKLSLIFFCLRLCFRENNKIKFYFNSFDRFFYIFPFFLLMRNSRISGVMLGFNSHYFEPSANAWVFLRAKIKYFYLCLLSFAPQISVCFVVDEYLVDFFRRSQFIREDKFKLIEDVGKIEDCRHTHRWVKNSRMRNEYRILVYGVLSERKGVLDLLAAALDASRLAGAPNFSILLAGRKTEPLRSQITEWTASKGGSLVKVEHLDRFIESSEEADLFGSVDFVWVGYREGFLGSTGVGLKALSVGTPLIGRNRGWIGRFMSDRPVGVLFDDFDDLVRKLVDLPNFHYDSEVFQREKLVDRSKENFATKVVESL